jgi:hypothetical protein
MVRLSVKGAGCDFEVAHAGGFQRTPDGAFGVSPIANLEWTDAPPPMKSALAGLLSALAADPSLTIRAGDPLRHPEGGGEGKHRKPWLIASGAALALILGGLVWMRSRTARGAKARPKNSE